jgi:hypothetical protein
MVGKLMVGQAFVAVSLSILVERVSQRMGIQFMLE